MVQVKDYPEFSWSFTKHKMLLECELRYALSYYYSYGGWRQDASNRSRHIYRLKTLQSINMAFGSAVHSQIHRIVGQPDSWKKMPTESEIMTNVRADLNKAYQDSKYRHASWYENPSNTQMLMEIYYDGELPFEVIEDYQTRLPVTAQNLLSCPTIHHDLLQKRNDFKLITSERFRCIEFKGVKVWVVLDLLYQDLKNKKYVIVDFKTGKHSANGDEVTQLMLYAWFVREAFGIDSLEQIELRNEYLADGRTLTFIPTPFDFEKIEYLLHTSIERMHSYLKDVERNVPTELEQFQPTKNRRACERCSFRELCNVV
ncbi:PD-(D/E)XK nuclease family protein [Brevibacillus borstelensis]|uniref:PD-(D/E)XK nuclease family protein n=1 Tax=Brevibacillus borstelensis TaxID=45462 RepID=UPI00203EBBAE|nr:PD-(D/E)XK nuclease family protein [Brevibacillus borstelensis]MCM3472194.1 PD-(D/E)XK nuclease family protein [Brevibacillus borstelensis]